ncbi:MAG: Bax inhibitor-1/YccA family protein [Actinomycetes bacterium]
MESRNPVIARMEKEAQRNGGYAGFGTATATATAPAPGGTGVQPGVPLQAQPLGTPMTINDVIVRTAAMFIPLLITAYITWTVELSYGWVIVAALVAMGLAFWGLLAKKVRPPVFLLYGAVEGVFIGGTSYWFQQWVYNSQFAQGKDTTNIVAQAVIGTLAAFLAVLVLYATRIIKVTGTFKKMMLIAMFAYLGIAVVSLFSAFIFGTGNGWGFFGVGGLGLLLCAAGVLLAAFSLALDFDAIEKSIAYGLPEQESWRLALGLTVTLVWLYLEILRLLAILNSR